MTEAPVRLLVAADGSAGALAAVRHAIALARHGYAGEIHLLNVQPPLPGIAADFVDPGTRAAFHRGEGMGALAEAIALLEGAGLHPHIHIGVGDPAETILGFARTLGCGHIVMGTRGHGRITELVLGSVAHAVSARATVPVTLVRVP